MYNFHYKLIVNTYDFCVRLCITDIDSLLDDTQTDDVYKYIEKNHALFNTSDYLPSHTCYSETNRKILDTFKDKTNGVTLVEFVDLRAKCYSLVSLNYVEKR